MQSNVQPEVTQSPAGILNEDPKHHMKDQDKRILKVFLLARKDLCSQIQAVHLSGVHLPGSTVSILRNAFPSFIPFSGLPSSLALVIPLSRTSVCEHFALWLQAVKKRALGGFTRSDLASDTFREHFCFSFTAFLLVVASFLPLGWTFYVSVKVDLSLPPHTGHIGR